MITAKTWEENPGGRGQGGENPEGFLEEVTWN